jgi:hypothetical protein
MSESAGEWEALIVRLFVYVAAVVGLAWSTYALTVFVGSWVGAVWLTVITWGVGGMLFVQAQRARATARDQKVFRDGQEPTGGIELPSPPRAPRGAR